MKNFLQTLPSLLFGKPHDTISYVQYWISIIFLIAFCSVIFVADVFMLPHLIYSFGYLGALARSLFAMIVTLVGGLAIVQVLRLVSWWMRVSSTFLGRLSG